MKAKFIVSLFFNYMIIVIINVQLNIFIKYFIWKFDYCDER